jgi:hypothetical protein
MKTVKTLHYGDFIKIYNIKELIEERIKNRLPDKIKKDRLAAFNSLETNKQYEVVDFCKCCRFAVIKVNECFLQIKYKYIVEVL